MLEASRAELAKAAERRDRLGVYRASDMQGALISDLRRKSAATLRLVRSNTPSFTGETPYNDGCMDGDGGAA